MWIVEPPSLVPSSQIPTDPILQSKRRVFYLVRSEFNRRGAAKIYFLL